MRRPASFLLLLPALALLAGGCRSGGSAPKQAAPSEPPGEPTVEAKEEVLPPGSPPAPTGGASGGGFAAGDDDGDLGDDKGEGGRAKEATARPALRRNADSSLTITIVSARGVDEQALKLALDARAGALRACHEKELLRAPSLEGSASAELSFDAGGVVGVHVEGLGDATLERCLEDVLRAMKVERADPGRGSAKVRLTLTRG